MGRMIYLERTNEGCSPFECSSGRVGDKTRAFASHAEAQAFADHKMGRRGIIVDSTSMKREQHA